MGQSINVVEIVADQDNCAFDQPCLYGHRVESYAVYCHNDWWEDAPRKCRHSKDRPHAECPGFKKNQSPGGGAR